MKNLKYFIFIYFSIMPIHRHVARIYVKDFVSYFAVGIVLEILGMFFLEFAPFEYLRWQQILIGSLIIDVVFAMAMTLYVNGVHRRMVEKAVDLAGIQRV